MRPPALTVIVPTRDRPLDLSRCLDALARQEFDGELEIVVVDDGSRDAAAVERAVSAFPDVRIVRLESRGVAAARNEGAQAARAERVSFTDDDCIAAPDWAATLYARLDTAPVVAGLTEIGGGSDHLAAAAQIVANALLDDNLHNGAPGSNLACLRSVVEAVAFDEDYAGIGAEDRDWFARVVDAGYAVAFEPAAVVRHFPSLRWCGFLGKSARYGRGAYRYRHAHRGGRLEKPGFYLRLVRAGFGSGAVTGAAVCASQVATAIGFAREALAARRR
jgi:glycosyltransferase involved in cell wall biosynthesis